MVNEKEDRKTGKASTDRNGAGAGKKPRGRRAGKSDDNKGKNGKDGKLETKTDSQANVIEAAGKSGTGETDQTSGQGLKSSTRRYRISYLILTVLILGSIGVLMYQMMEIGEIWHGNIAQVRSLSARMDTLEQSNASLIEKNESLEARLTGTDERISELLDKFSILYQQRNNDAGWQLMEIKYLLLSASHRLALERDMDTALAILQTADARLRDIPDPGLLPVREQLIADINRLKGLPRTDFTGLALLLSGLAGQVGQLPLKPGRIDTESAVPAEVETVPAESRWRRLLDAVWRELKTLVVVSRADETDTTVLLPQERYFVYQNLRLQLEAARLSLLIRDKAQFQGSLSACRRWLSDYFDIADQRVASALASLERAAQTDFQQTAPSVERSLLALDKYLGLQTRTTGNTGARQ